MKYELAILCISSVPCYMRQAGCFCPHSSVYARFFARDKEIAFTTSGVFAQRELVGL